MPLHNILVMTAKDHALTMLEQDPPFAGSQHSTCPHPQDGIIDTMIGTGTWSAMVMSAAVVVVVATAIATTTYLQGITVVSAVSDPGMVTLGLGMRTTDTATIAGVVEVNETRATIMTVGTVGTVERAERIAMIERVGKTGITGRVETVAKVEAAGQVAIITADRQGPWIPWLRLWLTEGI